MLFSLNASSTLDLASQADTERFASPYRDIPNLPIPTIFRRRKNSQALKAPPPTANERIKASLTSSMQKVPCATVSILFIVELLNGSHSSQNLSKEISFLPVERRYLIKRLSTYSNLTIASLTRIGMVWVTRYLASKPCL